MFFCQNPALADHHRAVEACVKPFGKLDSGIGSAGFWNYLITLDDIPAERVDIAFDEMFHVEDAQPLRNRLKEQRFKGIGIERGANMNRTSENVIPEFSRTWRCRFCCAIFARGSSSGHAPKDALRRRSQPSLGHCRCHAWILPSCINS